MNFKAVVSAIIPFFQAENCRFALAGAFALHAYGLSRATGDIDFLLDSACREKVVRYLEDLGYETIYKSEGYSNHVHSISSMGRVDFIYVDGETAKSLFSEMGPSLKIDQWSIPVPSAEHLIALKVFAMKSDPSRTFQEMADIQFLINLPDTDRNRVKQYFEQYGLLERYYEILEKNIE